MLIIKKCFETIETHGRDVDIGLDEDKDDQRVILKGQSSQIGKLCRIMHYQSVNMFIEMFYLHWHVNEYN